MAEESLPEVSLKEKNPVNIFNRFEPETNASPNSNAFSVRKALLTFHNYQLIRLTHMKFHANCVPLLVTLNLTSNSTPKLLTNPFLMSYHPTLRLIALSVGKTFLTLYLLMRKTVI